jgi:hypothetical protein
MEKKKGKDNSSLIILTVSAFVIFSLISAVLVSAIPDGATISVVGNSTKSPTGGGIANLTSGSQALPDVAGGYIFTMNVTGNTQNARWKAFIGNVTGKLTLQDSAGAVIYDWTLSQISGRVFATRSSATLNWSGIGCASLNITEEENRLLNHSSRDDNITATFATYSNQEFTVGTKTIAPNQCRTLNVYRNSAPNQVDTFEELVIYDRNSTPYDGFGSIGHVVYAQKLQAAGVGYNNNLYDFQMLVPERGESSWSSSTAYYFYVELS